MTSVALHHVVEGRPDAPPLLLLHSLGADLSIWEPLAVELRREFRVIRCDLRGHGASPVTPGPYGIELLARDVLALLDRLEITRAAICGTSLGGMLGLWLGAHAASRVARLAIVCSSARLPPAQAWHERAALVRAQGTRAVATSAVSRWFTPSFAARQPELISRMQRLVETTPAEGYAACCEAIADYDLRDQLGAIAAPTLVIAGGEDPAIPVAHAYALGAAIPNARVHVIERAAHLALAEQPARVLQLLTSHLGGDSGPRPRADAERTELGERTRRGVLGDAHVDRAKANTDPFTAPFQDFITRYAWGEIWTRPGLSRPERSLITLAVLTALHCDEELAMHVRAAVRNGLTREQIGEALLHVAIYAGVPAANRAFAVAQRVLSELG